MDKVIIEANIQQKDYEDFSLKDISLKTSGGDILAILGPNGNGKTTIIKCILNMARYKGSIQVLGFDTSGKNEEWKEYIGVVVDDFFFDEKLDIYHMKKILPYLYKNWDKNKFDNYIKSFELPEKKNFFKFSKGMKEKFLLAVALSHHAKLLILDEPTSGLDPIFRFELKNIINEYVAEEQASAIFTTHIITDIDNFANNIMIIKKGQCIVYDTTEELMNRYVLFKGNVNEMPETISEYNCYYKKEDYIEALVEKRFVENCSDTKFTVPTLEDIMISLCSRGNE